MRPREKVWRVLRGYSSGEGFLLFIFWLLIRHGNLTIFFLSTFILLYFERKHIDCVRVQGLVLQFLKELVMWN
jgi:hypothetical protein